MAAAPPVVPVLGGGVGAGGPIEGKVAFLPSQVLIPAGPGDQPLSFRLPIETKSISQIVIDFEQFRQWAAMRGENLSVAEYQECAEELNRRCQVLVGQRVDPWVWAPLVQPVTMGHHPMFLKLLALIAYVSGANRNMAVALVQVQARIGEERTKKLLPRP